MSLFYCPMFTMFVRLNYCLSVLPYISFSQRHGLRIYNSLSCFTSADSYFQVIRFSCVSTSVARYNTSLPALAPHFCLCMNNIPCLMYPMSVRLQLFCSAHIFARNLNKKPFLCRNVYNSSRMPLPVVSTHCTSASLIH